MPRGYRRRGRPINRRGRRSSRGTTGRDDFVRRYGSISSNSDVGGMADLMDGVEQDDGSIESMQMDNNTVGGRAPTRGAGRRGGRFRRGRAVAALDPATIRNEIVQHSCVPCASCKTTFKRYGDGLPGGKIRAARECVACKKGVAVPRIDTVPAYLVPYACCGEPDYRILSAVRVVDFEPRGQETMPEADARRMASLGPHARRRVKRQMQRYICYYSKRGPLVRAQECDMKLAQVGDPKAGAASALFNALVQHSELYRYWLAQRMEHLGIVTNTGGNVEESMQSGEDAFSQESEGHRAQRAGGAGMDALMQEDDVRVRVQNVARKKVYVSISTPLLEGAIFPWLYWRRELCESHGRDGNLVTDREHAKFEYACKALGEVVGYRANWQLLVFQHQRHLEAQLTAAAALAATPEYSLKDKPISPYFWRDHLACTQAIAIEYGRPPDVFATFTVNTAEDGFPVAKQVQEGGCMELGADCYSHFKTLEFIVEGLLCGWRGERQRWRNHLLRQELPRSMEISTAQHHNNCHNVLTYINRYEWQKRGVLHCHTIAWVRSTEAVKANLIKGSLDGRLSVEDQALFRRLQYTQDRKGEWSERACFLTALKLTQSHQDVQVGMADASLLTYVFKYILKAEVLRKVTDKYHTHQGINEVFETLQPQGGEMFMDMFGLRPVQYASNVQRKVYYVPTLQRLQAAAELPDEWSDYLGREALDLGQDVNNMSFATWMKKFVQIGPKQYERFMGAEERTAQQEAAVVGTAAAGGQDGAGIARSTRRRKAFDKRVVAFVTYSVTSDEAWLQFVLLYKRMVTLAEVLGPVPGKERAIAIEALGVHAAFFHFPDLLNMVHKQLEEGWHTQRHKERVLGYLHAQKIALQYQAGLMSQPQMMVSEAGLNEGQAAAFAAVKNMVGGEVHAILGGPGTGKSHVARLVVQHALQNRKLRVVVLTPTGKLHSTYIKQLAQMRMLGLPIYVDTYHAYFEIHKGGPNRAGYVEAKHWLDVDETAGILTLYIIDEISMVPEPHYLDMRTYVQGQGCPLLLVGDFDQLAPVEHRQTIMQRGTLGAIPHYLTEQMRCVDGALQEVLREIKRRTCSAEQLIACVGNVQYEHVHGWSISTKQMEALYRRDVVFKKCTVLCSTRSMCSIVNDAACAVLFAKKEPVIVCATAEGEGQALHKGMRLTVTENICKARGLVNGLSCTLVGMQGHCLHVRSEDGQETMDIWMVAEDDKVFYPVSRGYAVVVHTVQGQTLERIGIIFDRTRHRERGIAYTMVSRVRRGTDITLIGKVDVGMLNAV